MGLYGSGLSYAANGDKALWFAPMAGTHASYGPITTLIWVRDTAYSGAFHNGIYGGLGSSSTKAAMLTMTDSGNAVGLQQTDTGTQFSPAASSFLGTVTNQTWCPVVTEFLPNATATYLGPGSASFGVISPRAQSFDRVFLGDWNISRVGSYPTSDPCLPTTLMSEFAIWRTTLEDADMAVLFSGGSPLRVRPDALLAYYPLNGDLLDRGPRGVGLRGPRPVFGPHPPVEPPTHRRLSGLRTLIHNSAKVASSSTSKTGALATARRSARSAEITASSASGGAVRLMRGVTRSASMTMALAMMARAAKGRLSAASRASAKAAGPKKSTGESAGASVASAAAVAARAASSISRDASSGVAILTASRQAAGAALAASRASMAGGFVRSAKGSVASASRAALRLSFSHAAFGISRSVSSAKVALTQTFTATSKTATGQSITASLASASGTASRKAAGSASAASRSTAETANSMLAVSAEASISSARATMRRSARGSSTTSSKAFLAFTVLRKALGASASAGSASAEASGPRSASAASGDATTATATAVAERAAAGSSIGATKGSAFAAHGRAAGGVSANSGRTAAKFGRNLKAASRSASRAAAAALVSRLVVGVSRTVSSAVATAAYSQPSFGEWLLLSPASLNLLPLRIFLSWRTLAYRVDATGAVHANIPGFVDVGVQAEAIWQLLFDVVNNQPSAASVQTALDYGFQRKNQDGSFNSNSGQGALHDIGASFAFVAFVARASLLGQASGGKWALHVDPVALSSALRWLSSPNQIATLNQASQHNASGLLAAASGLLLGSLVLNDPSLQAAGAALMTQALALQNQAGWFNERGPYGDGFDAVYQGISIHHLAVVCSYFPKQVGWTTALQSAVNWMKTKIYSGVPSSGWLNMNGSTRSNGQETPIVNGAPEVLDLADVGFGMLLAGELLADTSAVSIGSSVLALYDATQSARDVIVR